MVDPTKMATARTRQNQQQEPGSPGPAMQKLNTALALRTETSDAAGVTDPELTELHLGRLQGGTMFVTNGANAADLSRVLSERPAEEYEVEQLAEAEKADWDRQNEGDRFE